MENPIKIDDLGVPLFLETPIFHQNVGFFPNQSRKNPIWMGINCMKLRWWSVGFGVDTFLVGGFNPFEKMIVKLDHFLK